VFGLEAELTLLLFLVSTNDVAVAMVGARVEAGCVVVGATISTPTLSTTATTIAVAAAPCATTSIVGR
jgi:hypothetical protein